MKAETLNAIDPSKILMAAPFSAFQADKIKPKYKTADGTRTVTAGDVVLLSTDYSNGGTAGSTYRYVGPDGAQINLSTEDYSNKTRWESFSQAADAGLNFFRTMTTFWSNNLGLDKNLADSFTQSSATGQEKASVAGSFAVLTMNQHADAVIRTGARINQDSTRWSAAQSVDVIARNENDAINIGGNFMTPGVGDVIGSSNNYRTWMMNTNFMSGNLSPLGSGSKDTDGAVGATVLVFDYRNDVNARIDDDVVLHSSSLQVAADNEVVGVSVGASGGQAEKMAFNGAVLVQNVSSSTIARVGSAATLDIGNRLVTDLHNKATNSSLVVTANDETNLVTVAGSLAASKQVGLGASVGVNQVNRTTEAMLGDTIRTDIPETQA